MDKRISIATSLSSMVYSDITEEGLEIIDLKIAKILNRNGTYGAILVDMKDKTFYIVFRGTEDKKDLLTDLECIQRKTHIDNKECRVHDGFMKAYEDVRDQINSTPFGSYNIVICGHSLGGALATICGADLLPLNARTVITFGSPRVGDKRFTEIFASEVKESFRFVHDSDIVPMVPNINYKHVGREVRLSDNGKEIGRYNFFKRVIHWIKGKGGFLSINDHYMINYLRCVNTWNASNS